MEDKLSTREQFAKWFDELAGTAEPKENPQSELASLPLYPQVKDAGEVIAGFELPPRDQFIEWFNVNF